MCSQTVCHFRQHTHRARHSVASSRTETQRPSPRSAGARDHRQVPSVWTAPGRLRPQAPCRHQRFGPTRPPFRAATPAESLPPAETARDAESGDDGVARSTSRRVTTDHPSGTSTEARRPLRSCTRKFTVGVVHPVASRVTRSAPDGRSGDDIACRERRRVQPKRMVPRTQVPVRIAPDCCRSSRSHHHRSRSRPVHATLACVLRAVSFRSTQTFPITARFSIANPRRTRILVNTSADRTCSLPLPRGPAEQWRRRGRDDRHAVVNRQLSHPGGAARPERTRPCDPTREPSRFPSHFRGDTVPPPAEGHRTTKPASCCDAGVPDHHGEWRRFTQPCFEHFCRLRDGQCARRRSDQRDDFRQRQSCP